MRRPAVLLAVLLVVKCSLVTAACFDGEEYDPAWKRSGIASPLSQNYYFDRLAARSFDNKPFTHIRFRPDGCSCGSCTGYNEVLSDNGRYSLSTDTADSSPAGLIMEFKTMDVPVSTSGGSLATGSPIAYHFDMERVGNTCPSGAAMKYFRFSRGGCMRDLEWEDGVVDGSSCGTGPERLTNEGLTTVLECASVASLAGTATWVATGVGAPLPNHQSFSRVGGRCPPGMVVRGLRFRRGGCGVTANWEDELLPDPCVSPSEINEGLVLELFCQPASICPTLSAPPFGSIDCTGNYYEDTCTISCDTGYSSSGDTFRTCGLPSVHSAVGVWSGSASAECTPVTCPAPAFPDPANGDFFCPGPWGYNKECLYSCDTGYDLVGTSSRICTESGTWSSGSEPTCQIVSCGASQPAPSNGARVCSGTTYGDTCDYSCVTGYRISGTATRTCQASGSWSGAPDASCSRVRCGILSQEDPENGKLECTGVEYLDTCTVSCDPGYELSGTEVRTCQDDGIWDGADDAACSRVNCGTLSQPPPGDGTKSCTGTLYEDKCTFACNSGFSLSGTAVRTCGTSASWTGSADASCIENLCDEKCVNCPATDNCAQCIEGWEGTDCSVCSDGYSGPSCEPVCVSDCVECASPDNCAVCLDQYTGSDCSSCATGYTASAYPNCQAVSCGALTSTPANGDMDCTGSTFSHTCTYTCDEGYNGHQTRECQADGSWSGSSSFSCDIIQCGPLLYPTPANGYISCTGQAFGDTCTVSCDDGHIFSGVEVFTCMATGVWQGNSQEAAACDPVDCGATTYVPEHGVVQSCDSFTTFGAECSYTCNEGYELVGSATTMCAASGIWTAAPTCEPVECGELAQTLYLGSIDCTGTTFGHTCNMSCIPGTIASGVLYRTCTAFGVWSSVPTAECTRKDCGPLVQSPPEGGGKACTGTLFEDTCSFSCPQGYSPTGSVVRMCGTEGTWTGTDDVSCVEIDCGELDQVPPGNAVKNCSGQKYLDVCKFTCNAGYLTLGTSERVCAPTADWSGSPDVTCLGVPCGDFWGAETIPNGFRSCTGSSFGDSCSYGCFQGFVAQGTTEFSCVANGTAPDGVWQNGTEPACVEDSSAIVAADESDDDDLGSTAGIIGGIAGALCCIILVLVVAVVITASRSKGGKMRRKEMFAEEGATVIVTQEDGMKAFVERLLDAKSTVRIGGGGAADVFKAQLETGDFVALKVLRTQSEAAKAEFHHEVTVLGELSDRNIVKLQFWVQDPLVMGLEYCDGGTLHDAIVDGTLSTRNKAQVLVNVAHALEYFHAFKNFAHLDVKPRNILLVNGATKDAISAKLTDFGSAMAAVKPHLVLGFNGTLQFTAPERFHIGSAIDLKKCDVFSLGVTIWSTYTGKQPHKGTAEADLISHYSARNASARESMASIGTEASEAPVEALEFTGNEDCPQTVAAFAASCMAVIPAERPTLNDGIAAFSAVL